MMALIPNLFLKQTVGFKPPCTATDTSMDLGKDYYTFQRAKIKSTDQIAQVYSSLKGATRALDKKYL